MQYSHAFEHTDVIDLESNSVVEDYGLVRSLQDSPKRGPFGWNSEQLQTLRRRFGRIPTVSDVKQESNQLEGVQRVFSFCESSSEEESENECSSPDDVLIPHGPLHTRHLGYHSQNSMECTEKNGREKVCNLTDNTTQECHDELSGTEEIVTTRTFEMTPRAHNLADENRIGICPLAVITTAVTNVTNNDGYRALPCSANYCNDESKSVSGSPSIANIKSAAYTLVNSSVVGDKKDYQTTLPYDYNTRSLTAFSSATVNHSNGQTMHRTTPTSTSFTQTSTYATKPCKSPQHHQDTVFPTQSLYQHTPERAKNTISSFSSFLPNSDSSPEIYSLPLDTTSRSSVARSLFSNNSHNNQCYDKTENGKYNATTSTTCNDLQEKRYNGKMKYDKPRKHACLTRQPSTRVVRRKQEKAAQEQKTIQERCTKKRTQHNHTKLRKPCREKKHPVTARKNRRIRKNNSKKSILASTQSVRSSSDGSSNDSQQKQIVASDQSQHDASSCTMMFCFACNALTSNEYEDSYGKFLEETVV